MRKVHFWPRVVASVEGLKFGHLKTLFILLLAFSFIDSLICIYHSAHSFLYLISFCRIFHRWISTSKEFSRMIAIISYFNAKDSSRNDEVGEMRLLLYLNRSFDDIMKFLDYL